jgi:hypothetical protein
MFLLRLNPSALSKLTSLLDCTMVQVASWQPVAADAWVHAWISLFGVYGGQSGTGQVYV